MRPSNAAAGAALAWAGLLAWFAVGPPAWAIVDDYSINGVFAATSDGQYATTDYAFHDEATIKSTWKISSICTTDEHCAGRVTSDQGWSAPVRTEGHVWYVEHDVPNWETCSDGTSFTGHQTFQFYPANSNGLTQIGSPYLEGRDKTTGPPFACGRDDPRRPKELTIVMQFRLEKIG